jgi:hypothetical protein
MVNEFDKNKYSNAKGAMCPRCNTVADYKGLLTLKCPKCSQIFWPNHIVLALLFLVMAFVSIFTLFLHIYMLFSRNDRFNWSDGLQFVDMALRFGIELVLVIGGLTALLKTLHRNK